MNRRSLVLFGEDLPAPVLSQLEASGRAAAWLVDIAGGRIVAANEKGAALLGLQPGPPAPVLDAAMPALARLRARASEPGQARDSGQPEDLVFWSRTGAERVHCRIQIAREGLRAFASIISVGDPRDLEGPPPSMPTPALFADDDAAKLKEIARRIREGQASEPRAQRRRPGPASGIGSAPAGADAPRSGRPSTKTPPEPRSHPVEPAISRTLRASLAHELKTPLSAISAAAEIMKDQRFGPLGTDRYVGYAADIHGSAQHLLGVIERMLAEGGGADPLSLPGNLDFAEIDAGAVLRSSVSQLAPLAERAGLALTLDLAPRLPHVVADATSLRQIVFNLLTNALKFTDRGGCVTVAACSNADGSLAIAISDTGPGFTRREIDMLLREAPQPRPPAAGTSGLGPGFGLGLPLVRALAAANGAELVIESDPNAGTSASVVFKKDRVIPV